MLTKYCSADLIDAKTSSRRLSLSGNEKVSAFEDVPSERFREDDDYLYMRVRAISSRVNKNYDSWPANELAGLDETEFNTLVEGLRSGTKTSSTFTAGKLDTREDYGFKTFIGRPVFVDHNNSDPTRARGVIVDAALHVEAPDKKLSADDHWASNEVFAYHKPETWVELLLEIDAKAFPKLAAAIEAGDLDSVSMGANVERSICSVCANEAESMDDFCSHIKGKGNAYFSQELGRKVIASEICRDVNFFEISTVFNPADPTALTTAPIRKKASRTTRAADTKKYFEKVASRVVMQIDAGELEDAADTISYIHEVFPKSYSSRVPLVKNTSELESDRFINRLLSALGEKSDRAFISRKLNMSRPKRLIFKEAEHLGWSNWDTWNTDLIASNDEETYSDLEDIILGLDYDFMSKEKVKDEFEDYLINKVIGPYNSFQIEEARGWNDIPQEERIDDSFESLKERNPDAARFVDELGFGSDTSDIEPALIDVNLVNFDEIFDAWVQNVVDQGMIKPQDDDDLTIPEDWAI